MLQNELILIDRLPEQALTPDHFRRVTQPVSPLEEGEVLVETHYLSIDAGNRAWLQGDTYRKRLKAGQVMEGFGVGKVVESRHGEWRPDDLVVGMLNWQAYGRHKGEHLTPAARGAPMIESLGALGIAGLTAYHGLFDIGGMRPEDRVVVSAAAGSVGSFATQFARLAGCDVVGIAGGASKCQFVENTLRARRCIDHRGSNFAEALRVAVPDGVSLFFDNVGGGVLDALLDNMARRGRIVCCGAVSEYETDYALANLSKRVTFKRLSLHGFIVSDCRDRHAQAQARIAAWIEAGQLESRFDIVDGLAAAPEALIGLVRGENVGKRVVNVKAAAPVRGKPAYG